MNTTADVIVIGGGPAGAGAVWALNRARPGMRLLLLEQGTQLASGASNASLENFRTCWNAPCLARLMTRSIEAFLHPRAFFGVESLGVRQRGYLFCATTPEHAATLRADVTHLHTLGLTHVEYLDADAVRARFGWVGAAVIAAKFDPLAGWLDSHALVYAMVRHAGAVVRTDVRGVRIRVEGGRVRGVETADGFFSAPAVVIAAGAGARAVGRTAGIELPLVLRPRQSFTTPWRHPAFPPDAPMLIGAPPFPHVRPEAQDGALFGWEYALNTRRYPENGQVADHRVEPLDDVNAAKDPRFPSLVLAMLARQFRHAPDTGFNDARYLRGVDHRAGHYVYRANAYRTLPDGTRAPYHSQRAIIDRWDGIEGLFLSVGHVGHGIMSAPAAGEILAACVLGTALPDPAFADFGLGVPYVEHDSGGISGKG